ncbi:unnamed protein product [Adineta ricciae]|uniref:Uncharacterized protein n=1 Tax=Adineta ricciae TaxID=249248 RepID=A0A814WKG4_ADIRI|nr:unnamed protein product [Adineta ricciae]CAF1202421.1 unnamed protein product [Adineta ricciae]
MTANSRLLITCDCGKTVQKRNYGQHCSSKYHMKFILENQIDETEVNQCNDVPFDLTSYLRENDLRSNRSHVRAIVQRYAHTDPYTKKNFALMDDESISKQFHIDHIHEAQILACAIRRTRKFLPQNAYILSLHPLRRVFNDAPNLTITEAAINLSKGQAIRYFLGQYETKTDMTLLAAFIQTASGKERSIAHLARNITALINETSATMSESIRSIRQDNGHVTGTYRYEHVADEFDTIIDRMKLDWTESVKLRNGKIYQACK